MSQKEIAKYVKEQQDQLAEQRKTAMKDKGYKDFFQFPSSKTTPFTLCLVKPREREGNFGTQAIFRIKVKGEEKDYSVNKKNPVFRALIGYLANFKKDRKLLMTRTGSEKATRYAITEAEE